jgi:hypothetical protein
MRLDFLDGARDAQQVADALYDELGLFGAARTAETLASQTKGDMRAFWLGVAKLLRTRSAQTPAPQVIGIVSNDPPAADG